MKQTNAYDLVRNWLRRGDPGNDGSEPGPLEFASIRREILAVAFEKRASAWTLSPVWATAAAVLLAVWVGGSLEPPPTSPASDPRPAAFRGARPGPTTPQTRQIQFDTPGGTRVVWVLDPEFKV